MTERWNKSRPAPTVLNFEDLQSQHSSVLESASRDQAVWAAKDCFAVFIDSLNRLAARKTKEGSAIEFDKDDDDTLEFVSAAANLRSYIFGIEPKSKFDIKQMAGNIIPAIATTNAIIAGACVLQAFKVLRGDYSSAKQLYMWQSTDRAMAATFDKPNPECAICSVLRTDVAYTPDATLGDLVQALNDLGYTEEDFTILANDQLIFEQGDEDFEENLPNKLSSFELGSFIAIKCDGKEDLVLSVEESPSTNKGGAPEKVLHIKPVTIPTKKAQLHETGRAPALPLRSNGVTNGATNGETAGAKRKADDELEEVPAKKVQTEFVIDDDGSIFID
jgi:ubiquitin-like 1-activating enzyme E1 B